MRRNRNQYSIFDAGKVQNPPPTTAYEVRPVALKLLSFTVVRRRICLQRSSRLALIGKERSHRLQHLDARHLVHTDRMR